MDLSPQLVFAADVTDRVTCVKHRAKVLSRKYSGTCLVQSMHDTSVVPLVASEGTIGHTALPLFSGPAVLEDRADGERRPSSQ